MTSFGCFSLIIFLLISHYRIVNYYIIRFGLDLMVLSEPMFGRQNLDIECKYVPYIPSVFLSKVTKWLLYLFSLLYLFYFYFTFHCVPYLGIPYIGMERSRINLFENKTATARI